MAETKKSSVLIVDDESSNIITLTDILNAEYTVRAATNGRDVIKTAEKHLPDVILLDVVMPEMDGYAVIIELKKSDITKNIPVIFVTGLSDAADEEKGLALGAADYISKPFSPAIVKLRIRSQIQTINQIRTITAANHAKSNFLSTMSHEMRTPMNAIIGMTSIGKKKTSVEEKNQALNKIGDASSHLLGVINDILDMSKIEANKLELSPVEYNFDRLLQKVATVVNFRMDEKQQTYSVNIDSNIPRFVIGDDQRLIQVLTNLLSNAVKFTPSGGKISLEAFLAGEVDESCELRIEVTDSGIGISSEKQDKLFHAFEQAESGTSREYGGTGLGLTISKRIVELMGGRICLESELGKGAKFIFTVKVRRSEKSTDETNDYSKADGSRDISETTVGAFRDKKMLLVEDIEINREILVEFLKNTEIEIDCAENGKDALEMVEAAPRKYDIILMDIQMPKMDGYEAARRIRALPALQSVKLPIIAMTANVFKADIEECLAAGMDNHLSKPIDIDKVLELLLEYLI